MYPHERSLVAQLADKPFALIGVNSDSDLEEIREIVKEKNLTWRSFQNEQAYGDISDEWAIQGWPTVFIIDANGVIRSIGHGSDDKTIEKCLAEIGEDVKIVHKKEEKPEKKKDDEEKEDKKGGSEGDAE